jgi:hypothetical protein
MPIQPITQDPGPTGTAAVLREWTKGDWLNILLLCGSILVGVAVFEVGVRALGFDYNLSPNWRYNPVLGWSQIPNATYRVVIEGRPVRVSFNSMGFRDSEHMLAKPPGVKRIVFIGDSFCEAVQVNFEETFIRRLQDLLNAGEATRWEAINIGVGDFGTAQEYIALKEYGLAFDPDVVVQEVFPLNDPCNNGLGLYRLCLSENDRYRPYYVPSDGGLRQTYAQPIRTFLRHHLVTYDVMEYWILRFFGPDPQTPQAADDPRRRVLLRAAGFHGLDPLLYTFVKPEEQPPAVAEAWNVTDELIERIAQLTRARGIAYVGLVVPFELQVRKQAWDDFARLEPRPPMSRDYPERRLAALFARLGVPSVVLLDELQPYVNEVLPYVGGHLSVVGHRRAAEALYRRLLESGIATR